MKNIHIFEKKDSPEVTFDNEKKLFKMSGNSYPENSEETYAPIKQFLSDYKFNKDEQLFFEFKFNFINSTSTVYLAQMFKDIARLHKEGLRGSISWYYYHLDEELLELGENLSSIYNLPFIFISTDD